MTSKITKLENSLIMWLAAGYVVLAAIGTIFQIPALKILLSKPDIYIPAIAFYIFLLGRYVLRIEKKIDNLSLASFLSAIELTHSSLLLTIKETKPKSFWATYLNPLAFGSGNPLPGLEKYYSEIEELSVPDHRRIFGVLPRGSNIEKRRQQIRWIKAHWKRTATLPGYIDITRKKWRRG